ncbi:MAG: O-methyltransferase [Flavobacteriales bacterium]|nr:O-methyltransferase [Flavobacteriales bacterium]
MHFIDPALDAYCEAHSGEEPGYLKELAAETREKVQMPAMLSGHLQGRFLAMLSKLVRPRKAVEIGTYTGYSALCLAEGLAPGGELHTIDIDPYLPEMVHRYIEKAGMLDRITMHHRPALEVIPDLPAPFDLVFIDADKQNYPAYLEAVLPRMTKGGIIIADNVLWSGKVLQPAEALDEQTAALVRYSAMVRDDARLDRVMVPLRDGLLVARVK